MLLLHQFAIGPNNSMVALVVFASEDQYEPSSVLLLEAPYEGSARIGPKLVFEEMFGKADHAMGKSTAVCVKTDTHAYFVQLLEIHGYGGSSPLGGFVGQDLRSPFRIANLISCRSRQCSH